MAAGARVTSSSFTNPRPMCASILSTSTASLRPTGSPTACCAKSLWECCNEKGPSELHLLRDVFLHRHPPAVLAGLAEVARHRHGRHRGAVGAVVRAEDRDHAVGLQTCRRDRAQARG